MRLLSVALTTPSLLCDRFRILGDFITRTEMAAPAEPELVIWMLKFKLKTNQFEVIQEEECRKTPFLHGYFLFRRPPVDPPIAFRQGLGTFAPILPINIPVTSNDHCSPSHVRSHWESWRAISF
jgi:hypothetical protein